MNIYSPPSDIPVPAFDIADIPGYLADEKKYIEALQAWARRLADGSDIAGELISMPYADGRALYIVVKSSGKHGIMTVPVGDAWRDPYFENTVTVKILRDHIARSRRFAKMFKRGA